MNELCEYQNARCNDKNCSESIKLCNLNSGFLQSTHGTAFAATGLTTPISTTEHPTNQAVNQTTK